MRLLVFVYLQLLSLWLLSIRVYFLFLIHLLLPIKKRNLIGVWFVNQKGWTTMRGALFGVDL